MWWARRAIQNFWNQQPSSFEILYRYCGYKIPKRNKYIYFLGYSLLYQAISHVCPYCFITFRISCLLDCQHMWCFARFMRFVPFVQIKKRPMMEAASMVKLQASSMGVFTVFKLYKWYQIAQNTTISKTLFSVYKSQFGINLWGKF